MIVSKTDEVENSSVANKSETIKLDAIKLLIQETNLEIK